GYDLPKELRKPSGSVAFVDILAQWVLLVGTFHQVLHVDLESVWRVKPWRWFETRVKFLMTTDTPLARYFAPEEPQE
ncbi:hypothetical protein M1186_26025, partial [Salmonella enterica subsp. enterica serovar Minnesota]|uniref:hypothetical protein n=1 Tax=Salmonella enterica TaxID=28901 RepID=UPI0021B27040